MKVLCDFNLVAIGSGVSLSRFIAECELILRRASLKTSIHALGTNVEGEWEDISRAVGRCHERLHEMGAPRLMTTIRIASRVDRDQSIEEKVEAVQDQLRIINDSE